jgi:hypothetical protein
MVGWRASFFTVRCDASFPMMDGTTMEIGTEDRRNECLLMSYYGKIQKLMRRTSPDMGRSAEYYVIDI